MPFDHEKMDVYRAALEHLALSAEVIEATPTKGFEHVRDQLRRAALSIVLNIAEGAGKFQSADKRRFYLMARGSANECAALMDASTILGIVDGTKAEEVKTKLDGISAMLTKLSKSMER